VAFLPLCGDEADEAEEEEEKVAAPKTAEDTCDGEEEDGVAYAHNGEYSTRRDDGTHELSEEEEEKDCVQRGAEYAGAEKSAGDETSSRRIA
jgi:hypothetical protein